MKLLRCFLGCICRVCSTMNSVGTLLSLFNGGLKHLLVNHVGAGAALLG